MAAYMRTGTAGLPGHETSETGVTPRCRRLGKLVAASACALAAALLAQPAAGQTSLSPFSPFGLRLGSTVTWDANVFRVPESAPDPQAASGISGKSDRITTTTVGLIFDKLYSQQHFVANVSQTATRYDKFSILNREALDYQGAWLWQLTPRIIGELSVDHAESIISFEDAQILRRINTSSTTRKLTVDGWLFGGWHLLAGASELERENALLFAATPSISQTGRELGLRYVSESQSSVTGTRRSRRGINTGQAVDLVNFIDSNFAETETELLGNWVVSGRSTLTGRLTRFERRNEHVPQRDFSSVAGEARYVWLATGRVTLNVSAVRAVTPYALDTSTTYRVDDTFAIAPTWQVTDKLKMNLRASRQVTDFLGPVVPVAGPLRRDVLNSFLLAADWLPRRSLTLGATLRRDQRSSNTAGFEFNATMVGLSALVVF